MEVLNKSRYGNSHLQIRQNPIPVAEHPGHDLSKLLYFTYSLQALFSQVWSLFTCFTCAMILHDSHVLRLYLGLLLCLPANCDTLVTQSFAPES